MTAPTSDPAVPATGGPAAPPAPSTSPPAGTDGGDKDWKAEAEKWQALARKHEGLHKANHSAAEQGVQAREQLEKVLAALGRNPDGSEITDPEAAVAQAMERVQAAEDRLWTAGVKTNVYELAGTVGANAKLVYNSQEFRDLLDDLVDGDPGTPEFRAAVEQRMRDFVTANPEYASAGPAPVGQPAAPGAPRPDPSQGSRGAPTPTRARSLTDAVAAQLKTAQGG